VVSSLHEEAGDESVEGDVVEVAFETELHEVSAGLGGFSGPELEVQVAW